MIGIYKKHLFTIKKYTLDASNNPSVSTSYTEKGFISRKIRKFVDQQGNEILSSASIKMSYDATISLIDEINFDGRDWRVISVEHPGDFTNKYTVVYLQ